MRRKKSLKPTLDDRLESRVVLSPGVGISPVAVSPLNLSGRVRSLQTGAVDQINLAFDRYEQDILAAQGAYFGSASDLAKGYYKALIIQRTNLLAEQLTQIFSQLPNGVSRVSSARGQGTIVVQSFLRSRITGTSPTSMLIGLVGPRGSDNVIPAPNVVTGSNSSIATLYTQSVINTIETARAATLNASGYLLKSTFLHKSK